MPVAKKVVKTRRKRTTTRRKKAAGFNVYCYRVSSGMTLNFFALRADALAFERDHELPEGSTRKITVSSNEELTKILREHTI